MMPSVPAQLPDLDRLRREISFHDEQALRRRITLCQPQDFLFDEGEYLRHESWIIPAIARLGALPGKRLLDLGSGHGMAAVVFAKMGATVTAMDLSRGYLEETRIRAQVHSQSINCLACCGELLPFADGSFDLVWGNAVLHHLDLKLAVPEILRILAPGGHAIFCEPVNLNPLSRLARGFISPKDHTSDEMPLQGADLRLLETMCPRMDWQGSQLLGGLGRITGWKWLIRACDKSDDLLLRVIPLARHLCRYGIFKISNQQVA